MKWLKTSFRSNTILGILSMCSVLCFKSTTALASPTALANHSSTAVGLFNNMRTPAALIEGALIPLGIITAPTIKKEDTKTVKIMKRADMIIAVTSLLSEILAVTYSSIAINKLAEVTSPQTVGVAELIGQNHELAWIGTNVHFLISLMGFALIFGLKVYFQYGNPTGKIAIGWSIAAFLQALSIVNRGIAMGHGKVKDISTRFASNLFTLTARYVLLVLQTAKSGGICAIGAVVVACISTFLTVKTLVTNDEND